ncbi:four helix bundle protein [Candidatus Collierbacteria bacterium CG17_big_fil_post_rev_8_21_14_2_50_45_7]|uniref:Four helix bundle protein n=1 Tax=Candidatus Collierbacteria bacterium CG17_big_fil_post_rev_8_21_14_2_50_45_7 TaxID=1974536 RepID=A0A2M7FSP8_9BACT|nr:MAG: four helix bundle protein [Candidatus Collierbacteria bacterium CG17_big_fil_post_rev_8_21_14_2_50_45_7]
MEYNLETRSKTFARLVRNWINTIPKSITTIEDCKQLTRSSGSIGANYIEANESLSKKDFQMRVKIAKKEAKESIYWLDLLEQNNVNLDKERKKLLQECHELMNILGAILRNSQ